MRLNKIGEFLTTHHNFNLFRRVVRCQLLTVAVDEGEWKCRSGSILNGSYWRYMHVLVR